MSMTIVIAANATPSSVLRDIAVILRRQRENAVVLAGKAPTRVEQARIETLELIEKQLAAIKVGGS